jgi:phosphoglycolate phosphatase-like HAD superfamily hydrolase
MRLNTSALLCEYQTLFWDFDGVIKESLSVKAEAFERLFAPFGPRVAQQVRDHHERHGGLSRYEKLPLYLSWAGQDSSAGAVARYCELFAAAIFKGVAESPWVPGAREYLETHHSHQTCIVVTATPQEEIEKLMSLLGIAGWFREVHGAPATKTDAIRAALGRRPRQRALFIGDSAPDLAAAEAAGVEFMLRRTPFNRELQESYRGPQCDDFRGGE